MRWTGGSRQGDDLIEWDQLGRKPLKRTVKALQHHTAVERLHLLGEAESKVGAYIYLSIFKARNRYSYVSNSKQNSSSNVGEPR